MYSGSRTEARMFPQYQHSDRKRSSVISNPSFTLLEGPLQTVQNLEVNVAFCLALFTFLIFLFRRQQRLKADENEQHKIDDHIHIDYWRQLKTESNMSISIMDDQSIQSAARHVQSHSRDLVPSAPLAAVAVVPSSPPPAKTCKTKSQTSDRFPCLQWAREEEYCELCFGHNRRLLLQKPLQLSQKGTEISVRGVASTLLPQPLNYIGHEMPLSPSNNYESVVRYGPCTTGMTYHTWTPPPPWAEAARRVFPRDVNSLRRILKINLLHRPPTLTISDGGGDTKKATATAHADDGRGHLPSDQHEFCLNATEFSVHPTPPSEGGVLEVYVKNSPKSEWMENTFQSAQAAAQFQTDLLATQLMGTAIQNMYHVFRLIHQGSLAFDGPECVLHDDTVNTDPAKDHLIAVGAAWDDVMRCFGSTFPRIRMQLEDLWWNETKPRYNRHNNTNNAVHKSSFASSNSNAVLTTEVQQDDQNVEASAEDGLAECTAEYVNKRVLLGPVDFFRLFVPIMPLDAVPYTTSDVDRMQQVLRWRKLVARASLLVQSYARARQLVNLGWNLGYDKPPEGYWKFRLAYDMNIDNQARDRVSKNEYYEPYVSRDVFCRVRGVNFPQRKWWTLTGQPGESVLSLGQTFSLVGAHTFKLPSTGADSFDERLNIQTDPVLVIPSLRELVEANPDVDFFVQAAYLKTVSTVNITVFARNTPVGVDPSFDTVWERYKGGNEAYRKQRLEFVFQLDLTTFTFPLFQALCMHVLAFLIWILDVKGFVSQSSSGYYYTFADRYPLPPMKAEHLGFCRHFGGALVSDAPAPTNYVAVNCDVDPLRWCTLAARVIIFFLTANMLEREIRDVLIKIRGEDESELPERILCVKRDVQVNLYQIALSTHCAFYNRHRISQIALAKHQQSEIPSKFHVLTRALFLDPSVAAARACAEVVGVGNTETIEQANTQSLRPVSSGRKSYRGRKPEIISTNDPFDLAVNKLIELLEDVRIPVREETHWSAATNEAKRPDNRLSVPLGSAPSAQEALEARNDLQQVSILRVLNRSDLLRFFVASDCSLKKATVRIVESASWRGLTFPVDVGTCRVELQTGQFFQQGHDLEGHPVFYFRNMCKGPWRGDEDAVIAAVIHRLEKSMVEFAKQDPNVRCTLIILLGKPQLKTKATDASTNGESASSQGSIEGSLNNQDSFDVDELETNDGMESNGDFLEDGSADDVASKTIGVVSNFDNPRVPNSENYYTHSNDQLVKRLIKLVMLHYPERLYRALIVKGNGATRGGRTVIRGMITLSGLVSSGNTRRKVKFIRKRTELQRYVDKRELIQLAGGDAAIASPAFNVN
ncbi:hypothetical protein ACA910_022203 [Epithemia clementina (nom. ined.)]